MKRVLIGAIALATGLSAQQTLAADATANALQSVFAALKITKVSDLDFGIAPQGDDVKTVAAGSADDAENASFAVAGEPNRAFTIALPTDGTVSMVHANGPGADQEIPVTAFTSFPATSGVIGGDGNASLLVGATRAALSPTQLPGSYSAAFTVTVIY